MVRYVCTMCGFLYDEDRGVPAQDISPGTKWEDVPEEYRCKMCGSPKSIFRVKVYERLE